MKRKVLIHIDNGIIQAVYTNDESIDIEYIDTDDQAIEPVETGNPHTVIISAEVIEKIKLELKNKAKP